MSFQEKVAALKPITFPYGPVTEMEIDQFRKATKTQHARGIPLTYPTCFRKAEFEWLHLLQVDMRTLLHTEQYYEYLSPLKIGDILKITTSVKSCREKRGMAFFVLETVIFSGGEQRIGSETTFVVRMGTV